MMNPSEGMVPVATTWNGVPCPPGKPVKDTGVPPEGKGHPFTAETVVSVPAPMNAVPGPGFTRVS